MQKMVYGKGNGCRGHYVQEFANLFATSHYFRTHAGLNLSTQDSVFYRYKCACQLSAFWPVGQQLSQLEKRDWELRAIVSLTGVLVGTGLLAVLANCWVSRRPVFAT